MAEGDTILRAARRLESALAGERLAVAVPSPRGRAAGVERLDGMRLNAVQARGKNLLLRFGDLVLHSHLGMNGSWRLHRRGERWSRPRARAWVVLGGSEWEAAQFGGPTLRVLAAGALRGDPRLARLGPDVLDPAFDRAAAVASMRRADPARSVGEALLDQSLVAGIGNIFKSEACFAARVDPRLPLDRIGDEELQRVLKAARGLMLEAVEGGRRRPAVYRRAGRPCPRCGTRLAAIGQGDDLRSTYFCPGCQDGGR